ncbi:MAG: hypothetical protein M3456_01235 [Actinomycetota bacterium]|nr:hypothetical protein [Actinomycetota bacterium]
MRGQGEKEAKAAANKEIDNPLVGTWRRTRTCDDYVSQLRQAGLADKIPSHQEFVGEFGADNTQSGQDPDDPCAGIKEAPVAHDNVFYKNGRFAALDENGEFTDAGHYKVPNDHTIVWPPPSDPTDPWSTGPAVTAHFNFSNDHDTVKFDVVLPDNLDECSQLCRDVYGWGVIATYSERPWNHVPPEDQWPGEAS